MKDDRTLAEKFDTVVRKWKKENNNLACSHNEMVETDNISHVWKCAHCEYVYGES